MLINSLSLENIRSYDKATIDFSSGTTLLTGDIGSGKTTVLLALEFALFGILRGKTSPQELLAHDAQEGKITLRCDINDKDIIVTRGLKRGSAGINQTPGEISINGVKEILVATELKARILTLLGYPESLLAKSTNLFRYTVYTPQEQVKAILFESPDERKDVVRKIFALDKYKVVQDNISHYTSFVRERVERLKGQTDDVKTLKEQLSSYMKRAEEFAKQLPSLEEKVGLATKAHAQAKEELEKIRKEQEAKAKLEAQTKLATQDLSSTQEMLKVYDDRELSLKKIITSFKEETIELDKEKEGKIKQALSAIADKKAILNQKYGELASNNERADKLIEQISGLETCPTCQQQVDINHKKHIKEEQQKILNTNKERRAKLKQLEESILAKEKDILVKQEEYQKQLREQAVFLQRKKEWEKAKQELVTLDTVLERQKKIILEKDELAKKLVSILEQTKDVSDAKEKLLSEKTEKDFREANNALQEIKGQVKIIDEQIKIHQRTIVDKEKIENEIIKLGSIKNWLGELFIPLVKTMEKKILLKVYQEFNTYFIRWFDQLLADENLNVKLDEDFTPVITQHGFDTHITNLSGGEKTSVALAYRLALNKVLNDYFFSIHTKGLLILDEPTDGFSAEQLDRLRDVLVDAKIAQLIIVSHEQKLESLAEYIIRVEKTAQHSQILAF